MAREYTTSICERCGSSWSHNPYRHPRFCSSACSNRRRGDNFEARFYARIDRSGGPDACWPWTGPRDKDGYGKVIHYSVGDTRSHRVALEFYRGQPLRSLPADVIVRHSCDNPPCCNPAHLTAGTHGDNSDDKVARDRHTRGEDVNTARMTEEDVMEARHLYRKEGVSSRELCARFKLSKSAMLYILNGKSWKHLPLLFLVLLMAVPAFGQSSTLGRLVIDTSQSEYATPSPDRNVICPVCEEAGKKSTVRRWTEPTTYGFSINYYQSEDRYWDEDGRYHDHELAQELLVCSAGHQFWDFDDHRCWCEWPNGRYMVVDEVKGATVTLPEVGITYTPSGMVIAPMSDWRPTSWPATPGPVHIVGVPEGEVLPLTPSKPKFDRTFWIASGLFASASAADIITTHKALERGGVESNPLHAQDGGRQLRWSSAIAATGGTFAFAAYCERKGHRRVARIVLITGAIVRTGLAFWNNSRRR